ncbi:MAG: hypothetical protein Q9184_007300 [Pyrenodesmia sp. 2 TL-2023]
MQNPTTLACIRECFDAHDYLAFSSPSAAQRSPNSIYIGSRGALVAATRVGTANSRAAGDVGRDTATRHQQNNATSSYIAANLAARLSTERLPLPSGSLAPTTRSQLAPSRAHSNLTIRTKSHRPAIHTLISRYEGDGARSRQDALQYSTIPQLSVSSLANAIVASSLASSRAPSPTRPPLPPPRRRHSRPHLFHRTHSAENEVGSRTPSPSKGAMRMTMRAPHDPSQDLGSKQKRNHFIHKHPNKHHEGSRKRWRDQVTEFERKRYEGVWAANRGLLLTHQYPSGRSSGGGADVSNSVLNLVVRDIWSRSHLPSSILEEIWSLVTLDNNGAETLGKEEFVVGMWLVDQALKGRKLPVKVSDSVWFSARGLSGIKVGGRH